MALTCNRCETPLPHWELAHQDEATCPGCEASNMVRVFPAFFQQAAPVSTELAAEGEAACFDHPSKRAVTSCSMCGRFVCQLCATDVRGQVWCPGCLTSGRQRAKVIDLGTSRVLFDSIALTISLAPLIFWPITMITSPVAMFVAVRFWKRPLSLIRRTRARYIAAIFVALCQIAGWIWGTAYFIAVLRQARIRP